MFVEITSLKASRQNVDVDFASKVTRNGFRGTYRTSSGGHNSFKELAAPLLVLNVGMTREIRV